MSTELKRHAISGPTMGTRYSAVFIAPADVDLSTVEHLLFAAVDEVDREMSTWKPDSDLQRLNWAAVGEAVDIPVRLADVLEAAIEFGRQSAGAFDIGVGDLVNAWGFGAEDADGSAIKALSGRARRPTHEVLVVDRRRLTATKLAPVELDLSAIAKGYGVDRLAESLETLGISSYLVGIDGEMRAAGHRLDGSPWVIAIEQPDRQRRDVRSVLELTGQAVATSGDYRHYAEVGNQVISHVMNPLSSRPLRNAIASVTVLASTCMAADALATVLMVKGEIEGPQFAREHGITALFVLRDGQGLRDILVGDLGGQTQISGRQRAVS